MTLHQPDEAVSVQQKTSAWDNLGRTLFQKNKRWLNSRYFVIGKWLVLSGMLYLAVRLASLTDVVSSFLQVSIPTHVGFLGLALLSRLFYAFRWHLICVNGLGLRDASILFLLRINLLSEFVEIATPSSLGGEAVRVLKLGARTGMAARSTVSIVADRLVGLASMVLITLALLPVLGASVAWRPHLTASSLLSILALSVAGFGIVILWLRRRNGQIQLPSVIQQLELSFPLLMTSVLVSVVGHLVFASGYYLLFQAIEPLSFHVAAGVTLTAQLARSIPISLLGIGLSEGSMVALASLVGVTPEAALTVVVIALGARYVFAACGLLIELSFDGKAFLNAAIEGKNTSFKRARGEPESVERGESLC